MAGPQDLFLQEPRRTQGRPADQYSVGAPEPQGFWGNFADAWLLDTSLGQVGVNIYSHLKGDELEREELHRREMAYQDADFNALEDMKEELYGMPLGILEEIYDAGSVAEVNRILEIHKDNTERRKALEGNFGARLLAGFLDPVNLIPIPLAVGKGVWTGMKAAAPITTATMVSTEALRHSLDPTSTIAETTVNIGAGILMGELIAGAAGAYQRGGARRAAYKMGNSKVAQGVRNRIPRWMSEPAQHAANKMQNAFDRMEAVNRWINNPVGDLEPTAIRAAHMSEAEFANTIRKTLDREDIDYDLWVSGEAPDSFGPRVERYQGVEDSRSIIVERGTADAMRLPIPEGVIDDTATHALYVMREGEWQFVGTGSKRDLAGQLDPFATRHVTSFNTPEAYVLGRMTFTDLYPDAPSRVDDPQGYKTWMDMHLKEVARDTNNIHQTETTLAEAHARIAIDLDAEFRAREQTLDGLQVEIKAMKKDLAEIRKKLKATKDKGWKKRRTKAIKEKEVALRDLQNAEFIAQGRLDQTKQHLIDSEKSSDPEAWDIKPTLTGLEQAFGATGQMPWYRLVKTQLRDLAPEQAADWQKLAYQLAGSPGLASYGHEAGIGAGASVESMARVWRGDYHAVKREVDRIYYEEYAKVGSNPTPTAIWALQKKQHAAAIWEKMHDKFGIGTRPEPSNLMTLDQFRSEVGKAMMRSDTNVREPLIEKAAREYRQLVRKFEVEGRKYGVFRTQEVMARKVEKNKARIEFYTGLIEKYPRNRKKYESWIEEREAQNIEYEMWLEQSKQDIDSAWTGEQGEHAWFHRVWNLQAVDEHADVLKDIIYRWYKDNPFVYRNGRKIELDLDEVALQARTEETFASIRREAIMGDSSHVMSHGKGSALEHNREYLAWLQEQKAAKAQADIAPGVDINEVTSYQGIDVVEPTVQRIHPEHGGKSPVSLRRNPDGSPIEIHINKAEIARTFRNKQWANPRTKGIKPLPEDSFKTVDDWLEFLLEHEAQHLNHPVIKAGQKGYAANENAINQAALKKLQSGKNFEIKVIDKRIDIINNRIKRLESGEAGPSMAGVPSGLIGRRLDIPNELLIEVGKGIQGPKGFGDEGVNFIHTNVEHVLFHYSERMAPVIEMAKRFGDYRMHDYLEDLGVKLDEAAAKVKPEARAKIDQEHEQLLQAAEDLRDKVLGIYGVPEDPSALTTRTIRLLMAWNTLTAMGRAFLTAINDIGMVVQVNGVRSMFGDLYDRFFNQQAVTKWKLADEEVRWAGQALEVENAIRSRQVMDLPAENIAFNKLERWTYDQQGNFFFLNLLSGWTDFAKRFSGSMIQSKLIKNALEWEAGTISKIDKEEMAKAGVTESMAKAWVREWRRAGEQRAPADQGFFLASTGEWLDQETVQSFRAVLGQAIDNTIITPMAADKPNFMSKDFGRMIMQYHGFSMAATHRIFMSNMQKRDKRALSTVMMMVTLSLMIDQIKRPDYIQLSMEDQLYRAVELSGTLGMITDLNTALEGATAGEYGFRSLAGLKNMERYSDWGSQIGAVAGAVPNQWLSLAATMTDSDADANKVARTLRYMVPYNNLWLWNDWVTRTQRSFAELAED